MMIRFIYACLLRLHPQHFRRRYAEEMLCTFDEAAGNRRTSPLLADAFVSLFRQWAFRSELWEGPASAGAAARAIDGVPVFYTSGSSMPRSGALFYGFLLSIAVFGAVSFSISHWGSGDAVRWSGSGFQRFAFPQARPRLVAPDARRTGNAMRQAVPSLEPAAIAKLDKKRDGKLVTRDDLIPGNSASETHPAPKQTYRIEMTGTPGVLVTLVRSRDGSLAPDELRAAPIAYRTALLFSLLDLNGDGRISKDEGELLDRADRNHDGVVTLDELQDALRSR